MEQLVLEILRSRFELAASRGASSTKSVPPPQRKATFAHANTSARICRKYPKPMTTMLPVMVHQTRFPKAACHDFAKVGCI